HHELRIARQRDAVNVIRAWDEGDGVVPRQVDISVFARRGASHGYYCRRRAQGLARTDVCQARRRNYGRLQLNRLGKFLKPASDSRRISGQSRDVTAGTRTHADPRRRKCSIDGYVIPTVVLVAIRAEVAAVRVGNRRGGSL